MRPVSPLASPSRDAREVVTYRPNVAAVIQNAAGEILVGERLDHADSWQFPQGGLDPGETPEAGLRREIQEEISLAPTGYTILDRRGPYRYLFPAGTTKKGFRGQEQYYFLLGLTAPESAVDVETAKPEFRRVRWIAPKDFRLAFLPTMKHEVYRQVFHDFFGLSIG